jgi:hypothetical protein
MIAIRLAIVIFILAGTCAACLPPAPVTVELKSKSASSCFTTDGPAFANRFVVLGPDSGPSSEKLSLSETTDLANAYCFASERFRGTLDNIDYLFVDAKNCNTPGDPSTCVGLTGGVENSGAWGERGKGGYTQVGIPAGLWVMGNPAAQYPAYESDILNLLMSWTDPSDNLAFISPTNTPNNANTSWMTVLAALTHEVGHVRWYEANVRSGYGAGYDFTRLNNCNFFVGWQVQTDTNGALEPPKRWRTFGNTNANLNDHLPQYGPSLKQFQPGINIDSTRADDLAQLLSSSNEPWVSLFGANAPDEDFVETFKFAVLIDAGLTSLPITIPTSNGLVLIDIPKSYLAGTNTNITNKVACIRRWL